ncbi:MAG: hypothetical protein ACKVYV_01825 [Limisphaerales bacterium]
MATAAPSIRGFDEAHRQDAGGLRRVVVPVNEAARVFRQRRP